MPKVTRQVSEEVGIKPIFPRSLDSTLAVQNILPLKVFLHNVQWDSGFMEEFGLKELCTFHSNGQ